MNCSSWLICSLSQQPPAFLSSISHPCWIWIQNSSLLQRATKCHSSEKVINSTAYSGSNYSECGLYNFPFSPSPCLPPSYCLLCTYFITLLHLCQKNKCKGHKQVGNINSAIFSLWMLESFGGGQGLEFFEDECV